MVDGEIDSADVITPKTIYKTKKDGTIVTEKGWESLNTPNKKPTVVEKQPEIPSFGYDPVDMPSPQQEKKRTHRVSLY